MTSRKHKTEITTTKVLVVSSGMEIAQVDVRKRTLTLAA